MDLIRTSCPGCGKNLQFPKGIANVICTNCGTSYVVHWYEGTVSLSAVEADIGNRTEVIEERLIEIDEYIEEVNAEIEAVRSKEQGLPLQKGCAVFGIFSLGIVVMAFFMTLGIDYFGKWPFYVSLVIVIGLGLVRMRRKLATPDEIASLRAARLRLEEGLGTLKEERARLEGLKESIGSDRQASVPNDDED
jgi:LSD1 subclass zinc finger protein